MDKEIAKSQINASVNDTSSCERTTDETACEEIHDEEGKQTSIISGGYDTTSGKQWKIIQYNQT